MPRSERIVVPIVGALFLLSGVWAGVWIGSDLIFWLRMRGAVTVTGELETVEAARGSDGQTMATVATYRYEFKEKAYKGDRSTIHQVADNFGEFQTALYDRLREAYEKRQSVPVFVNPDEPSMSALDLTLRPESTWFPLFYCVGATLLGLFALWYGPHRRRRPREPSEPGCLGNRGPSVP